MKRKLIYLSLLLFPSLFTVMCFGQPKFPNDMFQVSLDIDESQMEKAFIARYTVVETKKYNSPSIPSIDSVIAIKDVWLEKYWALVQENRNEIITSRDEPPLKLVINLKSNFEFGSWNLSKQWMILDEEGRTAEVRRNMIYIEKPDKIAKDYFELTAYKLSGTGSSVKKIPLYYFKLKKSD